MRAILNISVEKKPPNPLCFPRPSLLDSSPCSAVLKKGNPVFDQQFDILNTQVRTSVCFESEEESGRLFGLPSVSISASHLRLFFFPAPQHLCGSRVYVHLDISRERGRVCVWSVSLSVSVRHVVDTRTLYGYIHLYTCLHVCLSACTREVVSLDLFIPVCFFFTRFPTPSILFRILSSLDSQWVWLSCLSS